MFSKVNQTDLKIATEFRLRKRQENLSIWTQATVAHSPIKENISESISDIQNIPNKTQGTQKRGPNITVI